MPSARKRSFAYAVDKVDYVFSVRPTLASAVASARETSKCDRAVSALRPGARTGRNRSFLRISSSLPMGSIDRGRTRATRIEFEVSFRRDQSASRAADLLANNYQTDCWEKVVCGCRERLLALVDESLRG